MSAATWAPARLPEPTDIVSIAHTVTYDSTAGDAAVIDGMTCPMTGSPPIAMLPATRLRAVP